ncbi:hypothetical protein K474DRAFT_1673113 [Panus rudis PR-1116 ss-1]|nr:hypothetical protein K474DRAFT_1673113 [Panus rudis PR-1116 ss-1]
MPHLTHGICRYPSCPNRDKPNMRLRQCAKCRVTRYCSRECQKQHWSDHKEFCKSYLHMKDMLTEHSSRGELYDRYNKWVRTHNILFTETLVACLNLPQFPKNHERYCLKLDISYKPEEPSDAKCMEVLELELIEIPSNGGPEWDAIIEKRKKSEEDQKKAQRNAYGSGVVLLDLMLPTPNGPSLAMRRVLHLAWDSSLAAEKPQPELWTTRLMQFTREGIVPYQG